MFEATQRVVAQLAKAPQSMLTLGVRFYRYWLRPWLGNACRFEPTCSAYALSAIQDHGALRGALLSGARLMRCHPWCTGGHDPVPPVPPVPPVARGQRLFTRWLSADTPPSQDAAPSAASTTKTSQP